MTPVIHGCTDSGGAAGMQTRGKRKNSVMAVEKVKEYFRGTGIEVIELPESSATVELAAEAINIRNTFIKKR